MIPAEHTVKVGQAVIVKFSGLLVYAKCSCPGSRPVEHTARYINNHKDLFELASADRLSPSIDSSLPATSEGN